MSDGRHERDLLAAFEDAGYAGMRAPSSGSATDRDLPDVLVGKRDHADRDLSRAYALELKTTSSTTAYADASEVDALERFAESFGARPRLVAKFKGRGTRTRFWIVPPREARLTDEGNYGLPHSDIEDRATQVALPPTDAARGEVRRV